MERNKYDLHREVLTHKYADILKSFEETHGMTGPHRLELLPAAHRRLRGHAGQRHGK